MAATRACGSATLLAYVIRVNRLDKWKTGRAAKEAAQEVAEAAA